MKVAVVRVRGQVRVPKQVIDTLDLMRLYDKNYCVILEDTPQTLGMIKKVKDFVTYGSIDDAMINDLIAKRGQEYKGPEKDSKGKIEYKRRYFERDGKKFKKYFRLAPPIKGFGRKGIKKPFSRGGALGNRRDKISELLIRMI